MVIQKPSSCSAQPLDVANLCPTFRLVWTHSTGALLDLVWLLSIDQSRHQTTGRVERGSVETNFGRVCFLPEHDAEEDIWTGGPGLALCCQ